ncbi:hypothetical protein CspHIS471_0200250 [Cutaneotrichosporon sp. HIS471]|nr:hypothetical protein CspHIS471_0200250 [Cutaneotrichosporon sp. HIS471]
MTSTTQQALEGERFRRKHLSLMLGGLDAMTAFKAAVGSTPGRVHPNVVRATPFFANRGPSRRIGTVVNTYALTLRSVNDDENSNLEKLFFDENAILLPSRLACGGCADGRVKCFARREGTGYVCAATSEPFGEDKAVLQWVTHWRESAPYDYCGSEAEWLSDLDEVIVGLRQHVPKQGERRWPANTNADQLVRAGVVGEKDLNHDAATPKQEGDDSEPPRKRRYRSPDSRDRLEVRPAPRRSNEAPQMWNLTGVSHHRCLSKTNREHGGLPSPATTSRSANSPLDAEHRPAHLAMTDAYPLQHPSRPNGPRARSSSYSLPPPHQYQQHPPQLHVNTQPYHAQHHPQPHPYQPSHSRHASSSSSRSRGNSHQPPSLPVLHPPPTHRAVQRGPRSASYSQPTTPTVPSQPQDTSLPRTQEYYLTLQGHLVQAVALMQADEASLGAIAVGIEQLDFRKAELQDKQKRLKVDLRDRSNEVRRMREEMLALGDSKFLWNSDEGKGRGNGA